MDKNDIADLLEQKHQELFSWIALQPNDSWENGPENKWTLGQHILHLINTLQLLNNALSFPKFILKYKYGTANRPSRDYQTVAKKYQEKLIDNQERARVFNQNLRKPTLKEKEYLLTKFQIQQKKLQYKIKKLSDKQLDTLILPHPLLGKMTIREITMWSVYHTEHHFETLQKFYSNEILG